MKGARGILINITGSNRVTLHEVNEACTLIRAAAENEDVQVNFGLVHDEKMGDEVKITLTRNGKSMTVTATLGSDNGNPTG